MQERRVWINTQVTDLFRGSLDSKDHEIVRTPALGLMQRQTGIRPDPALG